MQANSYFCIAWIVNSMYADSIAYVCHLVSMVYFATSDLEGRWLKLAFEIKLAYVKQVVITAYLEEHLRSMLGC